MNGLNIKQQRFADEYIRTGNAYQSAINAGYSETYAKGNVVKLLENVSVKSYIEKRLEELKKESIAEQDEILQYLTSVMRGEMTEQTLVGQGEGYQEIDNIDVGAKDRIKAAELLGKRYRMWTEKIEAEVTTPTFVNDVPEDD
ncbi:terminase small subunit [Staphylococcus caprae]|uniref:terminase small subunit n=1 Tax=Staphylococcus caprae TaxID=29380 RepID=UPI003B212E65